MSDSPAVAVDILGVRVERHDWAATLAQIAAWIAEPMPGGTVRQICTVNPEFVMAARRDPRFAAALARADLRVADGVGILWAARLLGRPLQERVTGSDGIYRISARASQAGWSIFLLGAVPGVAEQAARQLQQLYPGLQVAGTHAGSPDDADWPDIRARLAAAQPAILFVAYGHPRQDLWIQQHRTELPARVAMGVGGALDFVAGVRRRAPAWLQRLGLEWAYRLLQEPWRWRRMLALPAFALQVLAQWAADRHRKVT